MDSLFQQFGEKTPDLKIYDDSIGLNSFASISKIKAIADSQIYMIETFYNNESKGCKLGFPPPYYQQIPPCEIQIGQDDYIISLTIKGLNQIEQLSFLTKKGINLNIGQSNSPICAQFYKQGCFVKTMAFGFSQCLKYISILFTPIGNENIGNKFPQNYSMNNPQILPNQPQMYSQVNQDLYPPPNFYDINSLGNNPQNSMGQQNFPNNIPSNINYNSNPYSQGMANLGNMNSSNPISTNNPFNYQGSMQNSMNNNPITGSIGLVPQNPIPIPDNYHPQAAQNYPPQKHQIPPISISKLIGNPKAKGTEFNDFINFVKPHLENGFSIRISRIRIYFNASHIIGIKPVYQTSDISGKNKQLVKKEHRGEDYSWAFSKRLYVDLANDEEIKTFACKFKENEGINYLNIVTTKNKIYEGGKNEGQLFVLTDFKRLIGFAGVTGKTLQALMIYSID